MKKLLITVLMLVSLAAILMMSACGSASSTSSAPTSAYHPPQTTTAAAMTTAPKPTYSIPAASLVPGTTRPQTSTSSGHYPAASPTSTGTIGLSAGGAKDITNFRENINNGYLPLPTDISYEGLFYDYFFDTGAAASANKLYSPSYTSAVTRDPISGQTEYYLSVGLNSGLKEEDFRRKLLNLVIVLDNSGSMEAEYDQYYYDGSGKQVNTYDEEGIHRMSKMDSAEDAVNSILDQLNGDDRFAIVTFNSSANIVKPMGWVNQINMESVKNRVWGLPVGGGTNLSAGIELGSRQFNDYYEANSYEYENRMIVLTDAQPNTGDISSQGLMDMIRSNASNRIYTTFIGIGVDFNSDLINEITQVKGANYYSVHSPRQFRARVQDEFEYMVTPLIFDVNLSFESSGWRIEKVFGSPDADESTGRLMKINTLFAAKADDTGAVKGGLILLKLRKTSSGNAPIYLKTTYEDRNGRTDGDRQTITLESTQPEYFDNSGIRKGILLTRYAALLKNWMLDERNHVHYSQSWEPCIREDTGIIIPDEYVGQWERQSLSLAVSSPYQQLIKKFSQYFASEMNAIEDRDLGQELDILNRLASH
jgi:Ca-activated chloride channel family protein